MKELCEGVPNPAPPAEPAAADPYDKRKMSF
jgi:hypothetical protein